jgi:hypothetical protein
MIPETYADGIGRIGFSEGMVRIELVSIVPSDKEGGDGKTEVRHRLVMTPHAFLRALQAQHSLLQKLEQAGLVKRQDASGTSSPAPSSPNFGVN